MIFICRMRVFKTWELCGILLSKSSSTKRVFESRVLYRTRVSKTQDASLLKHLKHVLTYYIDYLYYASSHISSYPIYFLFYFISTFSNNILFLYVKDHWKKILKKNFLFFLMFFEFKRYKRKIKGKRIKILNSKREFKKRSVTSQKCMSLNIYVVIYYFS